MYALTVDGSPGDHERIAEAATEALENSPYHSVRTVLCEWDQGILLLRGKLSSFHHKQVAQETVARIKGETPLINQIEVD
jgi:osmotically-inducible protein OsmY